MEFRPFASSRGRECRRGFGVVRCPAHVDGRCTVLCPSAARAFSLKAWMEAGATVSAAPTGGAETDALKTRSSYAPDCDASVQRYVRRLPPGRMSSLMWPVSSKVTESVLPSGHFATGWRCTKEHLQLRRFTSCHYRRKRQLWLCTTYLRCKP